MKQFIAFFLVLFSINMKAEDVKIGSNQDLIRQMLFASQSLKEQAQQIHLDEKPSPFQTIVDAAKLVDEGKKSEAIIRLQKIFENEKIETRVTLWAWSALRELGEKPEPKYAYQVLGVVLEMPSSGAYDTLAAYTDGSARYLNFSGAAIIWDVEDAKIKTLCQNFIDSTIPASSRATPRNTLALPTSGAQVTLLTRSGIYVISNPPGNVIGAGYALMMELMKRVKENNQTK